MSFYQSLISAETKEFVLAFLPYVLAVLAALVIAYLILLLTTPAETSTYDEKDTITSDRNDGRVVPDVNTADLEAYLHLDTIPVTGEQISAYTDGAKFVRDYSDRS